MVFSRSISKKISKFSPEQIDRIFHDYYEETESLKSIFDSLSTGLIVVDLDGLVINYNKVSERLLPFAFHLEDPKNEKIHFWELISEKEVSDFLKNVFSQNKTNITEEFTLATSGGSIRFIKISVSPLFKEKNIFGSIIKIEDITEAKNSQILLHRMESLASLTNLAASMAHEIKNPLGAISIHIQLLQKAIKKKREGDGFLPDEKFMENYISVINEEIERLNKTVVDFLFAVRPVNCTMELLNVADLLQEVTDFIKPEAESKNIRVETDFCEKNVKLLLDKKLFRDVIINFAQNSIAAIESVFGESSAEENNLKNGSLKGGLIEIKSLFLEDKDLFVIEFSDNGCGMSEETVSKIFEPYFTTKANGTGLGMTTAYKIIKEFGGEILVSSEIGKGSCFTLKLPVPQKDKKLLPGAKK